MIDSSVVLNGQMIAYTIYAIVVLLFMAWFAIKITKEGKNQTLKDRLFVVLIIVLVLSGVSLHITTSKTIPWVEIDLNRSHYQPDKTFEITVANHEFILPADTLRAKVNEYVLFDVKSEDLTYGFGIFRADKIMVCQMQVVPGHKNDLLWQFKKPGVYTIRSTEYSGPAGHKMVLKDILIITE